MSSIVMNPIVEEFKNVFSQLQRNNVGLIDHIYEPHVVFIDPFHEVNGLANLRDYFVNMYENVTNCIFTFEHQIVNSKSGALFWTMTLTHKNLNRGAAIEVNGSSLIRFQDKIHFHQDYFDAGALLYEHIPLLRNVIKTIKARV